MPPRIGHLLGVIFVWLILLLGFLSFIDCIQALFWKTNQYDHLQESIRGLCWMELDTRLGYVNLGYAYKNFNTYETRQEDILKRESPIIFFTVVKYFNLDDRLTIFLLYKSVSGNIVMSHKMVCLWKSSQNVHSILTISASLAFSWKNSRDQLLLKFQSHN
jgi:hypothetical protein